jgi:hypothetical protein
MSTTATVESLRDQLEGLLDESAGAIIRRERTRDFVSPFEYLQEEFAVSGRFQ